MEAIELRGLSNVTITGDPNGDAGSRGVIDGNGEVKLLLIF